MLLERILLACAQRQHQMAVGNGKLCPLEGRQTDLRQVQLILGMLQRLLER